MAIQALDNFRIIDLSTNVAGSYCSKLLAGFGAEVIKIEHPTGANGLREMGPFCNDQQDLETSIPFLWLNTGKKGVTLDLSTEDGMKILKMLLLESDVLLEDLGPAKNTALGLDYETLQANYPRLIVSSISNFGETGPYRDFVAEEILLQALSGMMSMTGETDQQPLAAGPNICHYTAGTHAYSATLMALFQREKVGCGQHVEISMMESSLENVEIALTTYLHAGKIPKRGPHIGVPWSSFECKDGYCVVISMPARKWSNASEIFDDPSLFQDKYKHIIDRIADRQAYEEVLQRQIRKFKKEELFFEGQERGLAFGMVASLEESSKLDQHRERNFFREIDHPKAGKHTYCDAPFKMSETPWQPARAPLIGEHNDQVYSGMLGFTREEIDDLQQRRII